MSYNDMFDLFQIYLKFEHSVGDPARIQVLYERAITDFPISNDLWLDYTRYMDKTLKVLLHEPVVDCFWGSFRRVNCYIHGSFLGR